MIPGTRSSSADCPTLQEEKNKSANWLYRQLVRALSWLALGTRPDITFATASLARFGRNPGCVHWEAAKRVLRYLKGTSGWHLKLGDDDSLFSGLTNTDWVVIAMIVALLELISSRLVVVPLVGNRRSRLAWLFCLQRPSIYVALCQVAKESKWMVELLKGLVFRLTMQWWFMLTIGGGFFLQGFMIVPNTSRYSINTPGVQSGPGRSLSNTCR